MVCEWCNWIMMKNWEPCADIIVGSLRQVGSMWLVSGAIGL